VELKPGNSRKMRWGDGAVATQPCAGFVLYGWPTTVSPTDMELAIVSTTYTRRRSSRDLVLARRSSIFDFCFASSFVIVGTVLAASKYLVTQARPLSFRPSFVRYYQQICRVGIS
jgi:hypothetical protein